MQILTADWETYYDKDYSLSKLTMEEYVRSPQFEAIMLGLRWPDGRKEIITGTHAEIEFKLQQIDWKQYAVLCHNTLFDAAIFTWKFNVKPAAWMDTLAMARAMFGGRNNSLAMLAKRYNLQDKGTEVLNALGKRRADFTKEQFDAYAEYCLHDVQLCYELFELMYNGWYDLEDMDRRGEYPRRELELIDKLIRMYTEPKLMLNVERLRAHLNEVVDRKRALLERAGADKDILMSNVKFAELLMSMGVVPPTKISPTTGKTTWAFAKTEPAMKELLEHPNPDVQAVVAARVGTKSTLEETRTWRFIEMAGRDPRMPIPLRYSAARTHRLGGTDKINMQNLPSRGAQGGKLKACIEAPPGYVLINCDSSNIEARMLAWLAEQDDLVEDFRNGVDTYCKLASKIFNKPITKADKQERFVGKTVVLGCGYQTGAAKLQSTLKASDFSLDFSMERCEEIIDTYRYSVPKIKDLWYKGDRAIETMHRNKECWFGREGVVLAEGRHGIRLPNGMYISYPQLHRAANKYGKEAWVYKDDTGLVDIYGGKLTENVVQALARIVVMYQLLKIAKKLRVVLTVHDSVVVIARQEEMMQALAYIEECMNWIPKWAEGCPITCESEVGKNYGDMFSVAELEEMIDKGLVIQQSKEVQDLCKTVLRSKGH